MTDLNLVPVARRVTKIPVGGDPREAWMEGVIRRGGSHNVRAEMGMEGDALKMVRGSTIVWFRWAKHNGGTFLVRAFVARREVVVFMVLIVASGILFSFFQTTESKVLLGLGGACAGYGASRVVDIVRLVRVGYMLLESDRGDAG